MKIYATIISMIIYVTAYGQIPVTDAAANASLMERIAQGAQQVKQGFESLKFLKDAKDAVTKVNNAVRDYNAIKDIYEMQRYLIESSTDDINKLTRSGGLTPAQTTKLYNEFNVLFETSITSIETLDKLLTDTLFEMNDAERMRMIRELKSELSVRISIAHATTRRYWLMAGQHDLNKLFLKQDGR